MCPPIQPVEELDEVERLLHACDLPVADLAATPAPIFFGTRSGTTLAAVIGLEIHGPVALLRSLAVDPGSRGHGAGRALVGFAESYASRAGVQELFLLTTSAREYFERLGYSARARDQAPAAIRATRQFSAICPDTSAFLGKRLSPR